MTNKQESVELTKTSLKYIVTTIITLACLMIGSISFGYVFNNSTKTIYVKPESSAIPIKVEPGAAYLHDQDGVVASGKVIKNIDGIDLIVQRDGTVDILEKNLFITIAKRFLLMELYKSPDGGWIQAFKKAKQQMNEEKEAKLDLTNTTQNQ